MSILCLSSPDVDSLTEQIQPTRLIGLMQQVFSDLSKSPESNLTPGIQCPERISIQTPHQTTLFMPSYWPSAGTAIKIISVPKSGVQSRVPATTAVISPETGQVEAIVSARTLTALRNAAGSAFATFLLRTRKAAARSLVLFGAGLQMEFHARLFLHSEVYGGTIQEVTIVNRSDNERLRSLILDLKRRFPHLEDQVKALVLSDREKVEEAVKNADIICTATSSKALLFPSDWVKPGAHLNLIGSYTPEMCEIDTELVQRAGLILVDSKDACRVEAGELIQAGWTEGEGRSELDRKILEVGSSAAQEVAGKINVDTITIFKSVGVGVQDVAIASLVVALAKDKGIGTVVPFE